MQITNICTQTDIPLICYHVQPAICKTMLFMSFFKLAALPKVLYPLLFTVVFTWGTQVLPISSYGKLRHETAKRRTILKLTAKQLACFSIPNVTFFSLTQPRFWPMNLILYLP